MPLPPPPPAPRPPQPSPASPPRRRRWPWVATAAALVLVVLAVGAVVVRRNEPEPDRSAAVLDRVNELLAGGGASGEPRAPSGQDAPAGSDAPSGPEAPPGGGGGDWSQPQNPTTTTPERPAGPLDELLGDALGADVDPRCLTADGSTPKLQGSVGGDVAEQVTTIARLVEEERGLRFERPVEPELVAADEFDQRIATMVQAEYPVEQAELDSRLLGLLGAVEPGTDLKELQTHLMSGQVVGYYDPDTGDIVVRVADGQTSLDANGQLTLAHELDHALTDQALGLPDTEAAGQSDANLAHLALVEGDATLLMQRFGLTNVGLLDQLQGAMAPDALAAQEDLANVPPYLRNELTFPYSAGLAYACRLHLTGGWPAVDAAYDHLPGSTAEILFADRAELAPTDLPDAERPGGEWTLARHDTFGAAPLLWLLQAPGGVESRSVASAEQAAQAWTGGEVSLFTDGPRSALALSLATDGGDGLCDAVEAWYVAAFDATAERAGGHVVLDGDDQTGVLSCSSGSVRLGIAPDEATATRLAG